MVLLRNNNISSSVSDRITDLIITLYQVKLLILLDNVVVFELHRLYVYDLFYRNVFFLAVL